MTGRIPSISRRELEVVLLRSKIESAIENLTGDFLLVKTNQEIHKSMFLEMGGFIKFGILHHKIETQENIEDTVASLVKERNFGISLIGNIPIKLPLQIKKITKAKRYIFSKNQVLSAAQSKGIRQEFMIYEKQNYYWIFEILGVQNIDEFTLRDRFLPEAHGARGMLPPKLARIMVNLAIEHNNQLTIYDPFCGTGRVLMEALLLGQNVLGSDIDPLAITATERNLTWLCSKFNLSTQNFSKKLFVAPIEEIKNHIKNNTCDAIVTEPYLGPPQTNEVSKDEQRKIFMSLKDIYLSLFQKAKFVLKSGGIIIVIFPIINGESLSKFVVDNLVELGYIIMHKDIVSRDKQIIGREIVKLKIK